MAKPRRSPVALGDATEMPEAGVRFGFWRDQFENVLKPNPGKIKTYGDVSESTASNLRRDYGLDCATKTEDGSLVLYVQWVPEKAESIKQATRDRGAKRRETMAAKRAANGGRTPAQTPAPSGKQPGASRS